MIEIKEAVKTFENGVTALSKINLRIEEGDFLYMTGESGAGKTTLLKLIHCDEFLTSGKILYNGAPILAQFSLHLWRRKVGFAYQDYMLMENRTVFENITLPIQIQGENFSKMSSRVKTVLHALQLQDKTNKRVNELSGGEKQRVSMARALIGKPDILLLDEPLGNLDKDTAAIVFKYITAMNEEGTTIIMATHHAVQVDSRPLKMIKLRRGRLAQKEYV
ncbi:MAG: ATP-binding cassette domain-containing protein [Caldisericota bacterium]|nr:ATP-binding cassette domain-containing protein [Caldisericota bacterium]